MPTYRRKVLVEAYQIPNNLNNANFRTWATTQGIEMWTADGGSALLVYTDDGAINARASDWIIKLENGNLRVLGNTRFTEEYTLVA